MSAYASECTLCGHMASNHRWSTEGGSLVDGPYTCECGCAMTQRTPVTPLTKRQYEATHADWIAAYSLLESRADASLESR